MKKIASLSAKFAGVASVVVGAAMPVVAFAQDAATTAESAGTATFVGSYTLWIAIVVGLIVSLLTLIFSSQMKGSTVGGVLGLFGIGTFLVVLGFLSVVIAWADPQVQKITHDLLFIVGYMLCLVGVLKVRKLAA